MGDFGDVLLQEVVDIRMSQHLGMGTCSADRFLSSLFVLGPHK